MLVLYIVHIQAEGFHGTTSVEHTELGKTKIQVKEKLKA